MAEIVTRRTMIAGSVMLAGAMVSGRAGNAQASCDPIRQRWPRTDELVTGNDRDLMLTTARAIMVKQGHAALVTIDDGALPRVRSVGTREPETDMTVWILTHRVSRKVAQLRARPEVALHYVDIEDVAEVTLMGIAELHDDVATVRAKNFFSDEQIAQYCPGFPDNYVMIAIRPLWLEMVAPGTGIKGDGSRWRPAGLTL